MRSFQIIYQLFSYLACACFNVCHFVAVSFSGLLLFSLLLMLFNKPEIKLTTSTTTTFLVTVVTIILSV